MEEQPRIKVRMLGEFSVSFEGRELSFGSHGVNKAVKLLQILLISTKEKGGISRSQLLENLFGSEELLDVSNSFRVTRYRLKKLLEEAGLPREDYIGREQEFYFWKNPEKVWIDAAAFLEKTEQAKKEKDRDRRRELLSEACALYGGDFLPALSGEEWAIVYSMRYKREYEEALYQLCGLLWERREYERILELTKTAARRYPFDEWQSLQMECLVHMNRYQDAQKLYEETSKLFFEELGIGPSEKMMSQLENMSSKMSRKFRDAGAIGDCLADRGGDGGAFYCSLPSFRDSYRLVQRNLERNGQPAFLMVCSLTDGRGNPLESRERLEPLSDALYESIKRSLRRGDSFARYSPSQFLILLLGTGKGNCDLIFRRIQERFVKSHASWKQNLEYAVFSVTDREVESSGMI